MSAKDRYFANDIFGGWIKITGTLSEEQSKSVRLGILREISAEQIKNWHPQNDGPYIPRCLQKKPTKEQK